MNAYGIGVRSGVLTPQPDDEQAWRQRLGLPAMSRDAGRDWDRTGRVRQPVTLKEPGDKAGSQKSATDESEDEDANAAAKQEEE